MDKREFAQQVDAIKQQLFRMAYLYLNNEASALEAVDESVYKAYKALKTLREPAYFTTWLTRILINECKKELKRQNRFSPMDYSPAEEMAEDDYDALPLKEAIAHLPETLRAVVILRYFAVFTLAETAQTLAIPQGTVVSRQRRALALLKLDLEEA